MNLKQQLRAVMEKARKIYADAGENMTDEQYAEVKSLMDQADELRAKIAESEERNATLAKLKNFGDAPDADPVGDDDKPAGSIGAHFVKSTGAQLKSRQRGQRFDIAAPEYKAASDPLTTTEDLTKFGSQRLSGVVNQHRDRLVVADLMGNLPMTGTVIEYLVEKVQRIQEGGPAAVAEGAKKPYIKYAAPELVTEPPSKIAVLSKITEEMLEDHAFLAAKVNTDLLYDLSAKEEKDLLNGDGTGANLKGLLQRNGIQTLTSANEDAWADDLYKAGDLVGEATNFMADALVMNLADYQRLRLKKDKNGQYMAGGMFQGQYGQGGIILNPPVWQYTTVVTNAVPKGTAIVGAFKQGATILRKGGVRVAATNVNVDDFENNLVTLRAEERLGLMVPLPAAFVKLTLTV
nr:MAG TPA: major capsid protein [Caudoviricetes sp.]